MMKQFLAVYLLLLGVITNASHGFLRQSSLRNPFGVGLFLQATPSNNHATQLGFSPPHLAVITEPDACKTEERLLQTLEVIRQAISSENGVDLISVRVEAGSKPRRVVQLVQELVKIASAASSRIMPRIVVSSDWVEAAVQGGAHGVHVKESHRARIPEIREQFTTAGLPSPLIGTSAHSVESAKEALVYKPDYFFVGTCYMTQTHPEKTTADLEGPALPGQIAKAIKGDVCIPVLAIGGINESNCAEPVGLGASGAATIRAVLQANDPAAVVEKMRENMATAYQKAM